MTYNLNGKTIKIDDAELKKIEVGLGVTREESIQIYLEDEGFLENAEQEKMENKAKGLRIDAGAGYERTSSLKERKPRTAKVSKEKISLFQTILQNLDRNEYISRENFRVLKENKLIEVEINGKLFSIDLVEHKPKKI